MTRRSESERTPAPRQEALPAAWSSRPSNAEDWLRELFSGALDIRVSEPDRRPARQLAPLPKVQETER